MSLPGSCSYTPKGGSSRLKQQADIDAFLDAFMEDAVEANGRFRTGGGKGESMYGQSAA